jgi:hypothetical protein
MSDGVDASVDEVKASRSEPVVDGAPPEAQLLKLAPAYDAMLRGGQLR